MTIFSWIVIPFFLVVILILTILFVMCAIYGLYCCVILIMKIFNKKHNYKYTQCNIPDHQIKSTNIIPYIGENFIYIIDQCIHNALCFWRINKTQVFNEKVNNKWNGRYQKNGCQSISGIAPKKLNQSIETAHSPDSSTEEKQNQPKENLTEGSVLFPFCCTPCSCSQARAERTISANISTNLSMIIY